MRRTRTKGFTLIELMIAVVIVGILAAIAYPSYSNYVQKSRRAEAQAELLRIAQLQERYYADNNTYATSLSDLGVSSTTPEGYYSLSLASTNPTETFTATATAIGAQANDTSCATLSIDAAGQKTSTGGGDCW